MKITKKLVFLLLVCLLLLSSVCLATDNTTVTNTNDGIAANNENISDNSVAKSNQVTSDDIVTDDDEDTTSTKVTNILNSDLYIGEENVVVEDAVNGNVFALGNTVTIKGEIVGDLFVLADTLTIEDTASVFGNVFAIANNFTMKGTVYDIYAISQNFELASSGYIYRDVKLYAQIVNLNGLIKKDAYIYASSITMPENAKNIIGGDLHYTSDEKLSFPEGAILGKVEYTEHVETEQTTGEIISSYILKFVNTILYAVVIILLVAFFTPKFAEKSSYVLTKRPWVTAGIGILAIILIPIIAIVIISTGFLTNISLALLVVYCLALSITLAVFSMAIGKYIEKKLPNPSRGKFILFSVLSAIVLWLLELIPFIGGYISLFIPVVGLGIIVFALFIRKDVSELEAKKESEKK